MSQRTKKKIPEIRPKTINKPNMIINQGSIFDYHSTLITAIKKAKIKKYGVSKQPKQVKKIVNAELIKCVFSNFHKIGFIIAFKEFNP